MLVLDNAAPAMLSAANDAEGAAGWAVVVLCALAPAETVGNCAAIGGAATGCCGWTVGNGVLLA